MNDTPVLCRSGVTDHYYHCDSHSGSGREGKRDKHDSKTARPPDPQHTLVDFL
jgi:hypothetical protein